MPGNYNFSQDELFSGVDKEGNLVLRDPKSLRPRGSISTTVEVVFLPRAYPRDILTKPTRPLLTPPLLTPPL